MQHSCHNQIRSRRQTRPEWAKGFTLIELLVTISILTVLIAIAIPTVRIISKDRRARESARIVGSVIADAQNRSQAGKLSGIWIERNPNLPNAANQIYRVRAPRPFSGYGFNSTTSVNPTINPLEFETQLPVEWSPANAMVHVNDYIQFNHRGPLYRISGVAAGSTPARTLVTLQRRVIDPPPPTTTAVAFKVFRRPARVETSLTQLPKGFLINLSFSGHGAGGQQFAGGTGPLIITFDESGQVEWVYPDGLNAPGEIPRGPIHLLVSENDIESNIPPLQNQRNLWVSVNHISGLTGVYSMAQSDPSSPLGAQLVDARSLARTGKTANQ